MSLLKYGFSTHEDMEDMSEVKYKKEYAIEETTGEDRLIVSPENNQIEAMINLLSASRNMDDNFFILFVLLISRCDNKTGRYQIANPMTWEDLNEFCKKYSTYLETDGRHHFWILNFSIDDLVVYDHHNVLYAYRNLEIKMKALENNGYKKVDSIRFCKPHCHIYNKENDIYENDIIKDNEWIITPLRDEDEYK